MKKHFISLFDADHLRETIKYFVIAALLISISLLVGISDNFLTILMLIIGIIFLWLAVLHPWKKSINYVILLVICASILILEFKGGIGTLVKMNLNNDLLEDIAFGLGFVCFAGIFVGIIGALVCANEKKLPLLLFPMLYVKYER
jgi:hypothetical protein